MKRTNTLTKVISLLLFSFLAIYFGVMAVGFLQNPLRTAPAIQMEAADGFFASGIIVRNEHIVSLGHPVVSPLVQEGERVSVGMAYLAVYETEADRDQAARRNQLEQEIAQLEAALALGQGGAQQSATETEIRREMRDFTADIHRGNFDQLDARTAALRTHTLAGDYDALSSRLSALRFELFDLSGQGLPAQTVFADRSGVFSSRVDGFEHLRVDAILADSMEAFETLLVQQAQGAQEQVGKIISGTSWYYIARIPAEEYDALYRRFTNQLPNRLMLHFPGVQRDYIPMRITAMTDVEEGYFKVVFASNTALTDTLGHRQVEVQIIYQTFSGIRVPRAALHWEEAPEEGPQHSYVFTLTMGQAEQKFVRVIYTGQDYYLVLPDTSRTSIESSLREGNSIILQPNNLYDGRVLRR